MEDSLGKRLSVSMLVLGINAFHGDSSACIIRDGLLIAAVEEERFRRVKHWAGFPSEAIRYCLDSASVNLGAIEHLAVNQDSRANLGKKLLFLARSRPRLGLVIDRFKNKRARLDIAGHLSRAFSEDTFRGTVHAVEHHFAHLSSAFHVSPFVDAATVSVDGLGDFASAEWGIGKGSGIFVDDRVLFPHSLGIFYQALTQFLGFPNYGDEYKVMGLAPYGEPAFADKVQSLVHLHKDGRFELDLRYFRHHREKIAFEWTGGSPTFGAIWADELRNLLGPERKPDEPLTQRHRDLARSVQVVYERAFFNILNALHKRHPVDAVTIAGGCGMNSVANGKITQNTPFRQVYVQSAAGDAGGAIGAAFAVWHKLGGERKFVMDHAYWGPSATNEEIEALLKSNAAAIAEAGCQMEFVADAGELCKRVAGYVAEGLVIGWFQGRMEWGPRALGNRSIVCDPRRADMKDILNLKIKRRESFRPFAPSILREKVTEWFEQDGDVPFMMQVYPIRPEKRAQIPAVTHVDGSGRLQTVERRTNERYYDLIKAFEALTGVPMVLNTSFNENEPVVCKPQEALDCFLRTKMDVLVMENWVVRRVA